MVWYVRLGLIGWLFSVAACASTPSFATIETTAAVSSPTSIVVATPIRSPVPSTPIVAASVPTLPPATVTQQPHTSTPLPTVSLPVPAIKISPTSAALTCPPLPTPTTLDTQAAVQHFEHGMMFWLDARNEIWALLNSPTEGQFYWRILPNLWVEGTPEVPDNTLSPPAGRLVPIRGFGQAWFTGGGLASKPLRDDFGWAIDAETGFTTTLTYYPQGFYAPDCTWEPKSGLYELKDDHGQVFQFVGAGGIAKLMSNDQ
jgi:hypothetical protein